MGDESIMTEAHTGVPVQMTEWFGHATGTFITKCLQTQGCNRSSAVAGASLSGCS